MIKNKVVVVTGGAGAIGQCFVEAIAKNGGIAVIADVDFDAAELLASKVGGQAEAAALDITSIYSITSLIDGLNQKYGRIDAVVNNAYPRNSNYGRKLEDVTYEDFCDHWISGKSDTDVARNNDC